MQPWYGIYTMGRCFSEMNVLPGMTYNLSTCLGWPMSNTLGGIYSAPPKDGFIGVEFKASSSVGGPVRCLFRF